MNLICYTTTEDDFKEGVLRMPKEDPTVSFFGGLCVLKGF